MTHPDNDSIPDDGSFFHIEGPDENGLAWLVVHHPDDFGRTLLLGDAEPAAQIMADWLAKVDFEEQALKPSS